MGFVRRSKGDTLYAITLGVPDKETRIQSLAKPSARPISEVRLLGSEEKLPWAQQEDALVIQRPREMPCEHAVAFKITLSGS